MPNYVKIRLSGRIFAGVAMGKNESFIRKCEQALVFRYLI
jgi:hypothetical protein